MRSRTRFRPQFSLRLFFCLLLVTGVGFGWVGRHLREHRAEQRLIAKIHASSPYYEPQHYVQQGSGKPPIPMMFF